MPPEKRDTVHTVEFLYALPSGATLMTGGLG